MATEQTIPKNPKVTVLMSVYNGENYLPEAVDSILTQTFTDFEFLIIDDASTDRTPEILRSYEDPRIQIVTNEENMGLAKSLNKGLALAKGDYIARMDADDISLPNRFKIQVKFMDKNLEIGISGTWIKTIGNVSGQIWDYPCDHETIKSNMLFGPLLAHPSVIIRKDIMLKSDLFYNEDCAHAQDYELWVRAIRTLRFANIPKVLLHYRFHYSTSKRNIQKEVSNKIWLSQLKELGISPTNDEFKVHEALCGHRIISGKSFLICANSWLEKLKNANLKLRIYPEPAFSNLLGHKWFFTCYASTYLGLEAWNLFNESKLSEAINLSRIQKVKFLFKCVIKYA